LIDEAVPDETAVIDDIVVEREDPVRQPVIAHDLPDIFDRLELGAAGRQRDNADVVGYRELFGRVPTSLIHQQHTMGARGDREQYLRQMGRHRFGIAQGQHQPGAPFGEAQDMLAMFRADCAKDLG